MYYVPIQKLFLGKFQLSSEARERAVPSTRIGRLVTFGGLGLGNNCSKPGLNFINTQRLTAQV